MEREKFFLSLMSESLAEELLNGAKVIDAFLPMSEKAKSKQFVVLERTTPRKDKDGREFVFAQYHAYDIDGFKKEFCLSTEYVKMRRKSVISRCYSKEGKI